MAWCGDRQAVRSRAGTGRRGAGPEGRHAAPVRGAGGSATSRRDEDPSRCCAVARRRDGAALTSSGSASAGSPYAVGRPGCRPSRSMVASRILNFWIFPVTVIGNSSVTTR